MLNQSLKQSLKNRLARLFVTQNRLQDEPYEAFRILLVAGMLVTVTFVTSAFAVFHYVYTENMANMMLNLITSISLLVLLWFLYKNKEVHFIGHVIAFMAIIFFPLFAIINEAKEFSLAWMFVPSFMLIPILGRFIGLMYVSQLYGILFFLSAINIDIWDNGNWSVISHIRLMVALLLVAALVLVLEQANSSLNEKVQQQRKKEQQQTRELQRISILDALTQVYNRHHFNEVVKQKYQELKNKELFVTFFIIDVDHFKFYNDQFGHQKGDEVLYQVAQCIRQFVKRHDDLVFRLGGEEFGGILISRDPVATENTLKTLVQEVEDLKIIHATKAAEEYVTVSMGIYSAKLDSEKAMEKIYSKADAALYKAKERGRNQAVLA